VSPARPSIASWFEAIGYPPPERVVRGDVTASLPTADLLDGGVLYLGVAVQGHGGPCRETTRAAALVGRHLRHGEPLSLDIIERADRHQQVPVVGKVVLLAVYAPGYRGAL
jgi:hypothetical protein